LCCSDGRTLISFDRYQLNARQKCDLFRGVMVSYHHCPYQRRTRRRQQHRAFVLAAADLRGCAEHGRDEPPLSLHPRTVRHEALRPFQHAAGLRCCISGTCVQLDQHICSRVRRQICDRLFCSFGEDILEAFFGGLRLGKTRLTFHLIVSCVYLCKLSLCAAAERLPARARTAASSDPRSCLIVGLLVQFCTRRCCSRW
jgi:hypothetical protein